MSTPITHRPRLLIATTGLAIVAALSVAIALHPTPAAEASTPRVAQVSSVEATVQMQQVLAEYAFATDHRDGTSLASHFTPTGSVHIFAPDDSGTSGQIAELDGRSAIANAVTNAQAPLPFLGAEHHVITDPIASFHAGTGHLTMQFTTLAIQGAKKPAGGWPAGTAGAQGTVKPFEAGYYDATFVQSGGNWLITRLDIRQELPVVFPGA